MNEYGFLCGCIWSFNTHEFSEICPDHRDQERPEYCSCLNIGEDDGITTCFEHHDCSDGSCTHNDGDDYESEPDDEE